MLFFHLLIRTQSVTPAYLSFDSNPKINKSIERWVDIQIEKVRERVSESERETGRERERD